MFLVCQSIQSAATWRWVTFQGVPLQAQPQPLFLQVKHWPPGGRHSEPMPLCSRVGGWPHVAPVASRSACVWRIIPQEDANLALQWHTCWSLSPWSNKFLVPIDQGWTALVGDASSSVPKPVHSLGWILVGASLLLAFRPPPPPPPPPE